MGYRPSAVLVKNSYQAVFDAPKGAIVTLVIGSVGLMPNGSGVNRSNLFACWRGCRVTVLVSGRSQSPEERDDTARIVNEALER